MRKDEDDIMLVLLRTCGVHSRRCLAREVLKEQQAAKLDVLVN